jgi:cell division protein FtsI/penicillin-binding protein 2
VLNPQTGDILAIYSNPTFDLRTMLKPIDAYIALEGNKARQAASQLAQPVNSTCQGSTVQNIHDDLGVSRRKTKSDVSEL